MLTTATSHANDVPSVPELVQVAVSQPIWPADCTRDIERDGLVLIDSALGNVHVSLRPSSESSDVAGCFGPDQQGVKVWKSKETLLPQTEYRLEVQPLDETGAPTGETLLSHFTTGDDVREPLSFGAAPATRVLPHTAAAADASSFSTESQREDVVLVRVALPGLLGGLSHRPLQLTAALLDDTSSEEALGARVRDAQQAAPHQPVAFQLQAVLGDEPSRRCLSITARDDFGELLTLPSELCLDLPAREAGEQEADNEPTGTGPVAAANEEAPYQLADNSNARLLSQQAELAADAGAGGCSVGGNRQTPDLSWLLLAALPFLAARRRLAAARA